MVLRYHLIVLLTFTELLPCWAAGASGNLTLCIKAQSPSDAIVVRGRMKTLKVSESISTDLKKYFGYTNLSVKSIKEQSGCREDNEQGISFFVTFQAIGTTERKGNITHFAKASIGEFLHVFLQASDIFKAIKGEVLKADLLWQGEITWNKHAGKSCQIYANWDSTERTLEESKIACLTNWMCKAIMCPRAETNGCTLRATTVMLDVDYEDCWRPDPRLHPKWEDEWDDRTQVLSDADETNDYKYDVNTNTSRNYDDDDEVAYEEGKWNRSSGYGDDEPFDAGADYNGTNDWADDTQDDNPIAPYPEGQDKIISVELFKNSGNITLCMRVRNGDSFLAKPEARDKLLSGAADDVISKGLKGRFGYTTRSVNIAKVMEGPKNCRKDDSLSFSYLVRFTVCSTDNTSINTSAEEHFKSNGSELQTPNDILHDFMESFGAWIWYADVVWDRNPVGVQRKCNAIVKRIKGRSGRRRTTTSVQPQSSSMGNVSPSLGNISSESNAHTLDVKLIAALIIAALCCVCMFGWMQRAPDGSARSVNSLEMAGGRRGPSHSDYINLGFPGSGSPVAIGSKNSAEARRAG